MGKDKPRHNPDKPANSGCYTDYHGRGGEWSCPYKDAGIVVLVKRYEQGELGGKGRSGKVQDREYEKE